MNKFDLPQGIEQTLKSDLPADAKEILRSQAEKMGVDADVYIRRVFDTFMAWVEKNPALRVRAAKLGYDWVLPFADYVRQMADEIALDWLIGMASEPDATPHQRAEAFQAWAYKPRRRVPPLSEEAVSRESIYAETSA